MILARCPDWMNEFHWLYNQSGPPPPPPDIVTRLWQVGFLFSCQMRAERQSRRGFGGGEERLVTLACNNRRGGAESAWSTTRQESKRGGRRVGAEPPESPGDVIALACWRHCERSLALTQEDIWIRGLPANQILLNESGPVSLLGLLMVERHSPQMDVLDGRSRSGAPAGRKFNHLQNALSDISKGISVQCSDLSPSWPWADPINFLIEGFSVDGKNEQRTSCATADASKSFIQRHRPPFLSIFNHNVTLTLGDDPLSFATKSDANEKKKTQKTFFNRKVKIVRRAWSRQSVAKKTQKTPKKTERRPRWELRISFSRCEFHSRFGC